MDFSDGRDKQGLQRLEWLRKPSLLEPPPTRRDTNYRPPGKALTHSPATQYIGGCMQGGVTHFPIGALSLSSERTQRRRKA